MDYNEFRDLRKNPNVCANEMSTPILKTLLSTLQERGILHEVNST